MGSTCFPSQGGPLNSRGCEFADAARCKYKRLTGRNRVSKLYYGAADVCIIYPGGGEEKEGED